MDEQYEYKIGDRVVVIDVSEINDATGIRTGSTGTVCTEAFDDSEGTVHGVEFDEEIQYGSSCYGRCINDNGYFMYTHEIALLESIADDSIELDDEFDRIFKSLFKE